MQLLNKTDQHHSDLLSGLYEGGLKIWECAFDMVDYMNETSMDFTGKRVLDLGCGAGLLGIHALLNGAAEVHFQDYNPEVIDCLTTANTIASCACKEPFSNNGAQHCNSDQLPFLSECALGLINKCTFFSGDWSDFSHLLHSSQIHHAIVSTSPSIGFYVLNHLITEPIILATKSHYVHVPTSKCRDELVSNPDLIEQLQQNRCFLWLGVDLVLESCVLESAANKNRNCWIACCLAKCNLNDKLCM